MKFMNKHFLSPNQEDAEEIIRVYDGTYNQRLDFDEFCQLVLPSTNPNLRNMAANRRFEPHFRASAPVKKEVINFF